MYLFVCFLRSFVRYLFRSFATSLVRSLFLYVLISFTMYFFRSLVPMCPYLFGSFVCPSLVVVFVR